MHENKKNNLLLFCFLKREINLKVLNFFKMFLKNFQKYLGENIDFQGCHNSPKVSQKLSLSNASFPFNFGAVSVHTKTNFGISFKKL